MMSLVRRPSASLVLLVLVAAGTLAGLLVREPRWLLLAVPPAALVAWRWPARLGVAGALALGLCHGGFARREESRSCRARWPAGPVSVPLRIEEPSLGRAIVSAAVLGARCGGSVGLRLPAGTSVRAGDLVVVGGRWLPRARGARPDGLLAAASLVPRGRAEGALDRVRNRLARTMLQLYGTRAGLIGALMVGSRASIDPDLMRAFARSGLVHLLSISGFHVGLIGAWIVLLGRLLGRRPLASRLAAVVVVSAYVAFIGAPPPALRAAVLALIGLVERWRQRSVGPGPLFALTALVVLLLDPWALTDVGAWLSVTALAGATAATRWSDRAISRAAAVRVVTASIGATAFTAPVAAFSLGSVSLAGIGLNLVGIPLAAAAVPGVALSLIVAPAAAGVARSLAAGGGLLLGVLEAAARLGARLPGAAITVEPGPLPAGAAVAVLALLGWIIGRRNTGPEAGRRLCWVVAPVPLVTLALALASRAHGGRGLTLHFLDVGQGDAALIETPHHRWILIDAGPAGPERDAGSRVVVPFLARHAVGRIDLAILSHAHLDHYGGSAAVLRSVPADLVAEPGEAVADPGYLGWLDAVDGAGTAWRPLRAGVRFAVDGVGFEVLHPDSGWSGWGRDLNDDSVVLRLRWRGFEALFPGDAGLATEAALAGRLGRVDLLKVGHHGSRTSSGAAWLAELAPRVAVVSTGPNRYGHPTAEALGRLAAAGADVWRTDREGTVTVEVVDSTIRVRGRRGVRVYPVNR